jgi:cation diffusion facilitator CzcD-associated flavoprotein CzcO
LEYFKTIATRYQLYANIRLNKQVLGASWDETQGRWTVEILDKSTGDVSTDWGHVLINASGILK